MTILGGDFLVIPFALVESKDAIYLRVNTIVRKKKIVQYWFKKG